MTAFKTIPHDSPEAHCLNDLDHKIWKIIARRANRGRGTPVWEFIGQLGKRAEIGGEDRLLMGQIQGGYVLTITGSYGDEQLLFGKLPKLHWPEAIPARAW
jgi:hypothetical protein